MSIINIQDHLFDIEAEHQTTPADHPFYIVYPDEMGGNWRVQAVPVAPESFESRKALPEVYVSLISHISSLRLVLASACFPWEASQWILRAIFLLSYYDIRIHY